MNTKTLTLSPIPKELWKEDKMKLIPYDLIVKKLIISIKGEEITSPRSYYWFYYITPQGQKIFLDIGSKTFGLGIENSEKGDRYYEDFLLNLILNEKNDLLVLNIDPNIDWKLNFISPNQFTYLAQKEIPPTLIFGNELIYSSKSIFNPNNKDLYGDFYDDKENISNKIKIELDNKIIKRGTYELVYKDQWKKKFDIDYVVDWCGPDLIIGYEEKTSPKYTYGEIENIGGLLNLLIYDLRDKWKKQIK